ncbi:hypothetical protein SUGI_0651940 [Cryptomeria japonica]|nr:hypothetical protein SUGI_0651940 [Cryptomeria japonica]
MAKKSQHSTRSNITQSSGSTATSKRRESKQNHLLNQLKSLEDELQRLEKLPIQTPKDAQAALAKGKSFIQRYNQMKKLLNDLQPQPQEEQIPNVFLRLSKSTETDMMVLKKEKDQAQQFFELCKTRAQALGRRYYNWNRTVKEVAGDRYSPGVNSNFNSPYIDDSTGKTFVLSPVSKYVNWCMVSPESVASKKFTVPRSKLSWHGELPSSESLVSKKFAVPRSKLSWHGELPSSESLVSKKFAVPRSKLSWHGELPESNGSKFLDQHDEYMGRPSDQFNRSMEDMSKPSDPFDRSMEDMGRLSDQFVRSMEDMSKPSDPFTSSVEDMDRLSDQFARSLEDMGKPSDPFTCSMEDMAKPSDQFTCSVEDMGMPSDQFTCSVEDIGRPSDQFVRSVEDIGKPSDQFTKSVDNMGRLSDQYGEQGESKDIIEKAYGVSVSSSVEGDDFADPFQSELQNLKEKDRVVSFHEETEHSTLGFDKKHFDLQQLSESVGSNYARNLYADADVDEVSSNNSEIESSKNDFQVELPEENLMEESVKNDFKVESAEENFKVLSPKDNFQVRYPEEVSEVQSPKELSKVQSFKENLEIQSSQEILNIQNGDDTLKVQSLKEVVKGPSSKNILKVQSLKKDMKVQSFLEYSKIESPKKHLKFQPLKKDRKVHYIKELSRVQSPIENSKLKLKKEDLNSQSPEIFSNIELYKDILKVESPEDDFKGRSPIEDLNSQPPKDFSNIRSSKDILKVESPKDDFKTQSPKANSKGQSPKHDSHVETCREVSKVVYFKEKLKGVHIPKEETKMDVDYKLRKWRHEGHFDQNESPLSKLDSYILSKYEEDEFMSLKECLHLRQENMIIPMRALGIEKFNQNFLDEQSKKQLHGFHKQTIQPFESDMDELYSLDFAEENIMEATIGVNVMDGMNEIVMMEELLRHNKIVEDGLHNPTQYLQGNNYKDTHKIGSPILKRFTDMHIEDNKEDQQERGAGEKEKENKNPRKKLGFFQNLFKCFRHFGGSLFKHLLNIFVIPLEILYRIIGGFFLG